MSQLNPCRLDQLKELLDNATKGDIHEIIKYATNLLLSKGHSSAPPPNEDDLNKLFKYVPDALHKNSLDISTDDVLDKGELVPNPEEFQQEIFEELLSLNLHKKKSKKPLTQWILDKPNKHPHLRNGLSTDRFKCLKKLGQITNEYDGVTGTMKGAIINCFRGKNSRTHPHADDESYINQDSSICTWSFGVTRGFNIFEKKRENPKCLRTFTLENGSLMVMQPGSQSCTKHKVMAPDTNNTSMNLESHVDDDDDLSDLRFSVSWRDLHDDDPDSSDTSNSGLNEVEKDCNNTDQMDTSVIFGTSISKYLNERKLQGRKNITVINYSQSGARIADVSNQMDDFFSSDKIENDKLKIKNVFISVGTNDVALLQQKTPNHLYIPLLNLIKKAKMLFSGAKIFFQSLLPMTVTSKFTVSNVLSFNRLVLKACASEKCFYLDVFKNFLDSYGYNNAHLFRWNSRKNLIDVHLNARGLGVLATSYIDHIRGRFNPIKY